MRTTLVTAPKCIALRTMAEMKEEAERVGFPMTATFEEKQQQTC
jgi:hypothetical protein